MFPITYIFGDVFTEVYGYSASRRAIWYGFFAAFLLVALSYIAVVIPPAPEFKDQAAYAAIFKSVGESYLPAYWLTGAENSPTLLPWPN